MAKEHATAIQEATRSRRSYVQLSCVDRQCKYQMIFCPFEIADTYTFNLFITQNKQLCITNNALAMMPHDVIVFDTRL